MKINKYVVAATVLSAMSVSPAVLGQMLSISPSTTTTTTTTTTISPTPTTTTAISPMPTSTTTATAAPLPCFPLPPGATSLPPGSTLPPGVSLCPPTAAPAPAPAATVAPAPTAAAAKTFSASMGKGYEHANEHGKEAQEEHFALTGTFSGDVLTVTAISHGHLRVGTKLSGMGLPGDGVVITEMLTGTGGVGTYKFKQL